MGVIETGEVCFLLELDIAWGNNIDTSAVETVWGGSGAVEVAFGSTSDGFGTAPGESSLQNYGDNNVGYFTFTCGSL